MRGIRGAKKAWSAGGTPLSLEYTLISRQRELGGLGAYLAPLRDLGLVWPGSLRVTPAARAIVNAFWEEADAPAHGGRFDNWARDVLSTSTRVERKVHGIRLATVGERSRLTSILGRKAQQDRLYEAIITQAPPPTAELAALIQAAHLAGIEEPRDVLQALLDGRCGPVSTPLRGLVALVWLAENLDRKGEQAIDAGVGLELLHNAALVHDDIQDGDHFRRNVQTVCREAKVRFLQVQDVALFANKSNVGLLAHHPSLVTEWDAVRDLSGLVVFLI